MNKRDRKQLTYHVTWEIDVEAVSMRDAAQKAFDTMQEPGNTATIFNVAISDGCGGAIEGETKTIDLLIEQKGNDCDCKN